MTGGVVFNQLLAVKHAALALAQSIDVLVENMGLEPKSVPAATSASSPEVAPDVVDPNAPCSHPATQRIPLPVMGTRRKFKCMDCNADVFVDEVEDNT